MNAVAKDLVVDILKSNGNAIRIAKDIEVLDAFAQIRENWSALRQGGADASVATVIEFIEKLVAEAKNGPLVKLLDAANMPGEQLRSALAGVADVFQQIDPKYRALLEPVTTFDEDGTRKNVGLVEWKVIGVDKAVSAGASAADIEYSLDLGAQASLLLEAGDTWPGEEPGVPDPLLRIGFAGGLEVSAKASLPLSLGGLKLGVEAARQAFVDYYFDARASDDLFARAVTRKLGDLPNPWSLGSVMSAIDTSDFVGAVFETDGHAGFSVEVSVADGFALPHDIEADVGLSFKARVKRRGTFYLKLRKLEASAESPAGLEVTVERKRVHESERALELGVDVDMAALGRRLSKVLERHEGALKDVLDQYRAFLTPGTYLQTKANAHLQALIAGLQADADLKSALKDAAQRVLGLDRAPGAKSLEEFLEGEITELLDGASGVVGGTLDGVAAEIGAAFVEKTGLPADLLDGVVEKLRTLISQIRADLEAQVKAAVESHAAKLLKQLDKAGSKVARAGDVANNAFEGVREVIGRYERALKRLKEAVADSARMKLTAQITAEASNLDERTVEARLIFKNASADARQLYKRVVQGDFDSILQLLDVGHADIIVDRNATTLEAFKATHRKLGYALVLLGFEVGGSTVFDAKSKVLVEGTGKVSVMSELTWKRRTSTSREKREVSFVDTYELAAARHTHDFSIGLALHHEDEVLKRKEVRGLLQSFEGATLLPPGTTQRALEVFDEWFGNGDAENIMADINFALRMKKKEVVRLLCLGERTGDAISSAGRRRVFGVVLDELVQGGVHDRAHLIELASLVHAQMNGKGSPSVVDVLFNYTPQEHRRVLANPDLSPTANRRVIRDLDRAHDLHKRCLSFVELIDRMGDIYEATPSFAESDGGWNEADYDAAQRDVSRYLKTWLKTGSRLFWISAKAHPLTVAFVGAFAALGEVGDRDSRGILSVTMTRRTLEPVTVVLC